MSTDTKERANTKSGKIGTPTLAQTLPHAVLLYMFSFIGDTLGLSRVSSVCRTWNASPLNAQWRTMYLRDYESDSCDDECICINGKATPWKIRYRQRMRVARNWTNGQVRNVVTEVPQPASMFWAMTTTPSCIATICASQIRLVDWSGIPLANWTVHGYANVRCIFIKANGDRLATSGDGPIRIHDIHSGRMTQTLPGESNGEHCLEFCEDRLISASSSHIRVWDLVTNKQSITFEAHDAWEPAVNWNANLLVLFTSQGDVLSLHDIRTGQPLGQVEINTYFSLKSLAMDAETHRLFAADRQHVYEVKYLDRKLEMIDCEVSAQKDIAYRVHKGELQPVDLRGWTSCNLKLISNSSCRIYTTFRKAAFRDVERNTLKIVDFADAENV